MLPHFNGIYWGRYIEKRVCADFQSFGDMVRNRVLPVFDGMKQEMDDLQERRRNELMSAVDDPQEDSSAKGEAMETPAFNEALEHATMLSAVYYATLNVYAAALYHLTEQHIVDLYTRILDYHGAEITPADASTWFNTDVGLDMEGLPTWPVINELRLVAHTVKHGEGHSAKALCELRPDLFTLPHHRSGVDGPVDLRVRKPLFGEGVYVTEDDFVTYHVGSVAFWNEIAAVLPNLTR
jgi:hypothetical protein